MLPLSEELRQAIAELRTWAALHRADNEPGIASALGVVQKAQAFIARAEQTHPDLPMILPDVGPRDVLVFRLPELDRELIGAIHDFYAAKAREAGAPLTDLVEQHSPLMIFLDPGVAVEKLDPEQMAEAGWIRKPSTERPT